MIRATLAAVSVCAGLMVAVTAARAEEPWKVGVTQKNQDAAQKLFLAANELYAQQAYTNATEKYQEALKLWDHPAIHLNLANSLVRLGKALDASEQLERALKFGAAPFEAELYDTALLLQSSLIGQVGWIEISCDQGGAKVTLDGTPVLTCPGSQKIRTLAKEHVIYADLKDHLGVSRRVVVPGGATLQEKIKLVPLADAVITKYKYPKWIPWTVAGVGSGVAIGGLLTYLSGRNLMSDFDQRFGNLNIRGATEQQLKDQDQDNGLYSLRESAQLRGTVGISLMAVGGGALLGGLFFGLVLNRPYSELPKIDVAPTAGGASASLRGTF